jgi:tetratricopeptide repeat protein 21B
MSLDETSVAALNGVILCQLLENQVDEAQQQIEFLNEIQSSIGKSAELHYLSAFLENLKNAPSEKVMQLLDDAVTTHAKVTENVPYSAEYFRLLAPDFTVQVAKLYLQYAPNDPPEKGDAAPPMLARVSHVLEALTKVAPGQIEAAYLLAHTKFLSGQTEAAQSGAQYCLKCDSTHTDAHLLMAQIHLVNNAPKAAAQSLEVALSYNFEVREAPMYHVIEARVHVSQNKLEDALKSLQNAMKINGVKKSVGKVPGKTKSKRVITIADRTTVYLEMTKLLYKMNQSHEASKLMQVCLLL